MGSHEVSFDDAENGFDVTVFVDTVRGYDVPKSKKGHNGLYLYMDTEHACHATSAYIPRKQAKKIIKAMKEALNEE